MKFKRLKNTAGKHFHIVCSFSNALYETAVYSTKGNNISYRSKLQTRLKESQVEKKLIKRENNIRTFRD